MHLWLGVGAILGFFSVGLGAFAAHGLRRRITADRVTIFQTGVQYQMVHALAILITALWMSIGGDITVEGDAEWAFLIGTLIFSGSLYGLAVTDRKWFGAIAPLGGVLFLAGWALLVGSAFASR